MRIIRKFKVRDNQKNEFDKFYLNYKFTHRISTDDINKINEQVNKEIKIMENYYINMMYQLACQTPTDIYLHLPKLMKYSLECLHLTEMGIREVVSTWAFVKSYPKKLVNFISS